MKYAPTAPPPGPCQMQTLPNRMQDGGSPILAGSLPRTMTRDQCRDECAADERCKVCNAYISLLIQTTKHRIIPLVEASEQCMFITTLFMETNLIVKIGNVLHKSASLCHDVIFWDAKISFNVPKVTTPLCNN